MNENTLWFIIQKKINGSSLVVKLISEKENERSKYSEKQCQDWLEDISKKDAIPSTVKDMGDLLLDID